MLFCFCMESAQSAFPIAKCQNCRYQIHTHISHLLEFKGPSNEVSPLLNYPFYSSCCSLFLRAQNHIILHSNFHRSERSSFLNRSARHSCHAGMTSLTQRPSGCKISSSHPISPRVCAGNRTSFRPPKTMWPFHIRYRRCTCLNKKFKSTHVKNDTGVK